MYNMNALWIIVHGACMINFINENVTGVKLCTMLESKTLQD